MGVVTGLAFGVILVIILLKIANRGRIKTEYDERQLAIRGTGYTIGFYTLCVLMGVECIWSMSGIGFPLPEYIIHFIEIMIGVTVMCVFCIWKGVYWGINNDRRRYGVIMLLVGLLNLIPVVPAIKSGSLANGDELESLPWMNVIVLMMMATIGITLLVKYFADRKTGEEEDA